MYSINRYAILEFSNWMLSNYGLKLIQKTDWIVFYHSILYKDSEVAMYIDLDEGDVKLAIKGKVLKDFNEVRKIAIIQKFIKMCLIRDKYE